MITVVTLNPCIDKTITVNNLKVGSTNRAIHTRTDIGGKGINVSLVLKTLNTDNINLLIDYTVGNESVSDFLISSGVKTTSIPSSNPLRTNTKIIDSGTSVMTEINESGLPVDSKAIKELLFKFDEIIEFTTVLVLCGSVPPGVETDIYKQMIHKAKSRGVMTILDSSSSAFSAGIEACPTLIKPNTQELSEYTNCNINTQTDIIKAAKILIEKGIQYVCVSDGENGAYLFTKDNIYYTAGAKISVASPQGAGDSMVAAFAKGLFTDESPEQMLINAVAAAQATVMREGTLLCTESDYRKLRNEINVKTLALD